VGYSLSIATLVLMYSLVIYGIVLPIISPGEGFKFSVLLLITGGTAGTIYFYDKVKLVFDAITEKLFFKSSYNLPKFLDEFNQALINSGGVEELASNIMNVISNTLKTDFLILAVKKDDFEITIDSRTKEPGREKYKEEVTPFLTKYHFKESQRVVLRDYIDKNRYKELHEILLSKDTPIAIDLSETSTHESSLKKALDSTERKILFLGPKKSGESYSVQDFDALRIIAKELVVALQNSMRFEEIKLFNLELQRKVDVATIKLRQQNKKLVAADELKDDFLSIASHQMRTPISTILGYTSILNSGDAGKMSKDQEKFSKIVESSTKRLAYLINDFLTVSRLKSGKFSIEKIETDLKVALKEEVVDLEHQFESKNVKLNVHIDGHVPMMRADEQKLRQVMMNLMDNALHYTPSGGKVEVTMKMDGKQVCFEVKDNGIGVPKAEQAKLFSKMFRAGNAQKMRPDGTGLGLYLAKKVVLGHGGHIIFNSKEGEGSTFGFKLPLK
jgi:signal transduction histidine kinase